VGDEGSQVALGRSVIIVGTGSLQNKLLANLIEQRTGYACSTRPADQLNGFLPATSLALIDAAEFARMQALRASGLFQSIALINADEQLPLELVVACPGVKGVFFTESSEDTLVKGIEAIFRGEYWLPRRLLCAHLERTRTVQRPAPLAATLLTRKELETLRLLATGNSTGDIAHELKVSPHTVKTHLYNLFRKIRVTKVPFSASAKALINDQPQGFVKLLSDPATGVVLGGSIVGRHAAELISVIALAVTCNLKVTDIVESVLVHPTLSEALADAAE